MLTTIVPAASRRLTSVENACLDLGRASEPTQDRQLARQIDQVSDRVAIVCNRAFGRQIYRESIDTISQEGVMLSVGPVNRIISISIAGGPNFELDQYALTGGTLRLTGGIGCIGDGSAWNLWRTCRPSLEVVYEAGWVLPGEEEGTTFTGKTPLPSDIERAVIQLLASYLSESGRDPTVRSENVQGVGSTTYSVQAPGSMLAHPGAEAALQPYRILALV